MFDINRFSKVQYELRENSPLIHCITNPISINDCANFVLAVGGKPIMAEHPLEVEDITATAQALALNIGNITDARLKSIELSAKKAAELSIPWIIDMVGVNCSRLRLEYTKKLLNTVKPSIIKGNMAEIKAICNINSNSKGIDVIGADITDFHNLEENISVVKKLAKKYNCVVIASGKIDIISDGSKNYTVNNGCKELSLVTGTGCILNCLVATFMAVDTPLNAGIWATAVLGVAGELADSGKGLGTYRVNLIDKVSVLTQKELIEYSDIKQK